MPSSSLAIVVATVGIGYSREYRAQTAAAALRARVQVHASVLRDGEPRSVPIEEVVPGDVVLLSAGSLVPADAVVLEATDCFVSEAVLTGESFPVEKRPGPVAADAPLARRDQLRLPRHQRAQRHRALPGRGTPGGDRVRRHRAPADAAAAGDRVRPRHPALRLPAHERDAVMVLLVFVVNVLRGRPLVETLLFSIALAVGLSPELLPAILSVNLARGAQHDGARTACWCGA